MQKVLLIANKTWEVDPLLNALLNPEFRPGSLPLPVELNYPRPFGLGEHYAPRAVYEFGRLQIEIWCIKDLMNPKKSAASSEEKNRIMPYIFDYSPFETSLVIAFGTAGMPTDASQNGSVSIGSYCFVHDGHPNGSNPNSQWYDKRFGILQESNAPEGLFSSLNQHFKENNVAKLLLKPRLNPAQTPVLFCEKDSLALSVVNVTDYSEYEQKDKEGIEAIKKAGITNPIISVETTHGVSRLQMEDKSPFIFITAITDRVGYFNQEVTPNAEAQNFTCSFNAGIVTAWLLPLLPELF